MLILSEDTIKEKNQTKMAKQNGELFFCAILMLAA